MRRFAGESEALEAVVRALDERRSLVLTRARYNRQPDENGLIINLANVVSVRVEDRQCSDRASTCDNWSSQGRTQQPKASILFPSSAPGTRSSARQPPGSARLSSGRGLRGGSPGTR
jgi:hypothetical protein